MLLVRLELAPAIPPAYCPHAKPHALSKSKGLGNQRACQQFGRCLTHMPNPEAQACTSIDAQLAAMGWIIQDYRAADFSIGRGIVLREVPLTTGPCDYLLLVDRKPIGIIEAKKAGTTFSTVAEQSDRYANSLCVPCDTRVQAERGCA
jgi:predicted type IV restriction endonuclease